MAAAARAMGWPEQIVDALTDFFTSRHFRDTATARLSSMAKMLRYFNYLLAAAP
jgi:hypothetical protein